jgi:hypothetical protein
MTASFPLSEPGHFAGQKRRQRRSVGGVRVVSGWLLGVVACFAAGCGGTAGSKNSTNRLCEQAGDDSVIAAALTSFLDHSDPEPGFLVYIPATDSTPPPAAVQRMQDRRTTYMYSAVPSQQAVVENRIKSYGDYDALLVAYHGLSKTDPLHPVVTFSGHYIGGTKVRGHVLGPLSIKPQCDSTGAWSTPPANAQAGAPHPTSPASGSATSPRAQ